MSRATRVRDVFSPQELVIVCAAARRAFTVQTVVNLVADELGEREDEVVRVAKKVEAFMEAG